MFGNFKDLDGFKKSIDENLKEAQKKAEKALNDARGVNDMFKSVQNSEIEIDGCKFSISINQNMSLTIMPLHSDMAVSKKLFDKICLFK